MKSRQRWFVLKKLLTQITEGKTKSFENYEVKKKDVIVL